MELEGVNFKVTAETGQLEQAEAEVRKFSTEAEQAQKTVDKFGTELSKTDKEAGRFIDSTGRMREKTGGYVKTADDATKSTSKLGSELDKTGKSTKSFTNDLTGMDAAALTAVKSMGVLAGAAGGYTIALANNVKEQQAWASAVGVSLQTMQGWGAAAKTVGRDVGFIGDVFKDANEKIGDFVATGGGEAKDVFEQLNIQAAELKNLSPDQQLLRIAEGLENVQTRGEKLFILESLANDASLLLPLLEDNARGLKEVTDQAERLGVVISDADASMLREVANEWTTLTQSMQGFGNTLATEYADDVASALNSISGGVQSLTEFIDENGEEIKTTVAILASAAASYGTVSAALLLYTNRTQIATAATTALNIAMSANPAGLLIRGLALVGGAFAGYMATLDDAEDKTDEYRASVEELAGAYDELTKSQLQNELARLANEFNKNAIALAEQKKVVEEAKEINDEFSSSLGFLGGIAVTATTDAAIAVGKLDRSSSELEGTQAALESAIAAVGAQLENLGKDADSAGDSLGETKDALEDYVKLHDSLSRALSGSNKPLIEYQKTLDAINALEVDAAKKAQLRQMAERKLNIELSKQQKAQRDIAGQLDVTTAAYNSYYDIVQQIVDSGADQETQAALLSKAYQVLSQDLADIAEEAEKAKDKADPFADAWEEATKRIDDSFARAWEGAFDSFESFADSIMGSFKTLLANLAHQAISKPILISMGIGGGMGASGSAMASTDADGGGFSLSSMGSMFSGNSIGSMISDFGGWIGGSSPIAGTGAGNYISGASANAANLANWQIAGGGMVGGILSDAMGLSGKYSAITGSIGTALSTALITPILGPFAPLLGGFVGSALGGLGNQEPSNKEGVATINLQTGGVEISGQEGKKFSQENRDAAEQLAAIVSSNVIGTISGLTDADLGGSVRVGTGNRDPLTLLYTSLEGTSYGFGKNVGGTRPDVELGLSTRDTEEYLDYVTEFFAGLADLDVSVYKSLADESELLIDTINRVELQFGLVTAAFDYVGLSTEKVTKQFADSWTDEFVKPLMQSGEELPAALARVAAQMGVITQYAELFEHSLGVTAEGVITASDTIIMAAGGLDQFAASAQSYYQNFYTEAERFDHFTSQLTDTFAELGYELPTTVEGFRAIVDGLDLTTESGQQMYATLLSLNPQVAQYIAGIESVTSVMDRLMGRADIALSGVMSAISAEREELSDRYNAERDAIMANRAARQDQLDAERDAFRELERSYSALDRAFGRMNMTDSASVFNRASGATEYLRAALESGGIPTADELGPYLKAAQEPTEELYSSFEDYARQFFIAKNLIGELRERAGEQLTTDEKALRESTKFYDNQLSALERQYDLDMEALDQQAEEAQSLYDAVTGVNDGILSVVDAIQQLEASLADVLSGALDSGGTFGTLPNGDRSVSFEDDPLTQAYRDILGRDPDVAGYKFYAGQLESGKSIDRIIAEIVGSAEAANPSIRGFANGGIHSGGLRIVGERGPELEYTGPSRIMNNGDLMDAMSSGAATERAVRNMDQNLMAGMRAIEKNTREIKQLQRRWDQQGLPPERTFE